MSWIEMEQIFSIDGIFIEFWKCNLQIDHFDHLIFINKNWPNNPTLSLLILQAHAKHNWSQQKKFMQSFKMKSNKKFFWISLTIIFHILFINFAPFIKMVERFTFFYLAHF